MQITYYGHSCFEVSLQGKKILFDPFIRPNPLAAHIRVEEIRPDYILISHGHEDHLADAIEIAQRSGACVISNYEIVSWLNKKGLEKTHPMNTGGKWMTDVAKVKCVSAIHSSSLPDGSYGGTAMGFIVESAEGILYYSGDTALTYDMKLIGEYRKLNVALLPIGDNFTMGIDNAVLAAEFIRCNHIIGLHYDTFGYIKIDHNEAINKFRSAGKKLTLMDIGHTTEV